MGWILGQEDALKKGMATHSSILAWRIPWTEEPGGLQFMRLQSPAPLKQLNHHQPESQEKDTEISRETPTPPDFSQPKK